MHDEGQCVLQENQSISLSDSRLIANAARVSYGSRMATGRQIIAARLMLGWTQADLSREANVSPSSVARAEAAWDSLPSMRVASLFAMLRAMERAGIIFIDDGEQSLAGGEGVRLRRRP